MIFQLVKMKMESYKYLFKIMMQKNRKKKTQFLSKVRL